LLVNRYSASLYLKKNVDHNPWRTDLKTELHREQQSGNGFRFAIVVSRWNDALTSRLLDGALAALKSVGAEEGSISTFRVPGAFELPLASLKAAQSGDFDAVVALGVVIRGETPHFDFVAGQAAAGILQASMQTGIPVLFGVITADTLEQAEARSGELGDNKGYESALSAVEMVNLIREMDRQKEQGRGD
jgi:6,7-dimethyl-8-ribityllumazine synthase